MHGRRWRVAQAVASDPVPYEVHTPVFEGDLELLTQLVSRQELDVFGLCLASLVEAFLAEAKAAVEAGVESFDLDTSTEFLLLAATLVELKTRYLLIEELPQEVPAQESAPPRDQPDGHRIAPHGAKKLGD